MSACDGKVGGVDLNADTDTRPPSCEPDDFNSLTQTRPAQLGIVVEDTICPRADQDFWQLTGIGGDKQLLSVDLVYEKLSSVELRADVWGPRGRCMPNALTACTANEQCAPTFDFCDTTRGGCRMAAAPVCFLDSNCATGESCYGTNTAVEQLGSVRIPATSVLQHRLTANYAAFAQGTYTVVVYDHAEREEEPVNTYSLTVTTQTDPDTNEPNDLINLATPLTHNVGVEGAMSYVDDVDWYVIQPVNGTNPAVVRVNLTYPATAVIAPTWTVVQGSFQYIGPNAKTEGSGGTASRRQQAAIVTPAAAPVYIRVQNGSTATNTTDRYNLTVEIADDPEEGATRNDDIANATNLAAPAPTAGGAQVINSTDRHLVALNDTDWYRISRPATADNTLLYFRNTAAANAPYSLVLQMYRETATACSPTNQCAQGRPCSQEGLCLDLMAQRPAPDGPGDPQQGGLSPNYLETQLPMFDDVSYVRVVNNAATTLDVAGYDFDKASPYTLLIRHKTEPDAVDRGTPDNRFLSRPFDAEESDFAPVYRNVTGGSTIVPGADGQPMAVARNPVNIATTGCVEVPLDLFDGRGAPLAGTHSIGVTAVGGTVQRGCGADTSGSPFASTGATTLIGVLPAGGPVTLTATVDGTGSVTSYLPNSGSLLFRSSVPNQPARRGVAEGSASDVVRIILPATSGTDTQLQLQMSAGTVLCANTDPANENNCLYANGSGYCSPTAPGLNSCRVTIPAGQLTYDVRAIFPASGAPQTMTVNATQRFQWVVYGAGSVVTNGPTTIQGYLSYDGDQDFFQIVPANVGAGGITIFLNYPASEIDIRAQATRGGAGAGVARQQDVCEDGCGSGTCTTARNTCHWATTVLSAGPEASSPECTYTSASGATPIRVWVNDTNSNDWDEVNQYTVEVEYNEGCPGVCPAAACR